MGLTSYITFFGLFIHYSGDGFQLSVKKQVDYVCVELYYSATFQI
jgi:hypothetical protein